jgi:hypothetical protein
MPKYSEATVSSVQDFINHVDKEKDLAESSGNHADFLFRGQRRDQPLLPKLARLKLSVADRNHKPPDPE